MYMAYNKKANDIIIQNTSIKSDYESFKDTAWHERYMLNSAQFYAAKDLSETKALQSLALESNGFKEFKDKSNEIVNINNDQWLRVEMDVCKRNAIQGEVFKNMVDNKDLYPYWVYKTMDDDRVRDEHAILNNVVFKIGDPEGDACHPENGWNCRCYTEPADGQYLKEENKTVSKGSDYLDAKDEKTGKSIIDENFKYNPFNQGPMPNDSSYSEVFESANKGNADLFADMPKAKEITGLSINEAKEVMQNLKLTDTELKAIKDYTGEKFNPINQYYRGIKKAITDENKQIADNLSSFLETAPKVSATTYRGISLNEYNIDQFIKTLIKDNRFADSGFMSTSYDKEQALKFGTSDRVKCIVEIKGKNGVLIETLSDAKKEKEILFNKESEMIIKDFKIKRDKKGIFTEIFVSLIEI
jgi:hypothetical protein